ncbi:protein sym-1 [Cajanus cajan]|uniref:Protein sym-1 n=1 Tax=Cajanus cajan TaxID=3821 RepID=A0A151TAQ5_CAJCA|nr:protein sym-1 [Cajanus cajan]XP_020219235.1 protein sym-1 [Cajanus cajan]XP_020219236.1 protein sym-1 [Cajanus cajan]KYP64121.1 Protein sym-1 [Cajanus cajan]
MVYGAMCAHAHKFLLSSRSLNRWRPQHTTRLQFHSRSSNFANSAAPFNPALLRLRNSRLYAVSNDGSGGNGARGGGSDGPNSGGSDRWSSGGDGGEKWSLLSWYLALLGKYPVPVKALTSAILTLIGDLVCQVLIDKVQTLDFKRTFVFSFLGFALVGPTLHFWYLYLSKLVTLPGASGAILRLVLDQFLFSPIFIGVFLSSLVTLEGRPSQVVPKLKQEWFSAVVANWQLWIPFQFFNFRFVPQQFQVLAANVLSLVWNVILSFKAHKEVLPK